MAGTPELPKIALTKRGIESGVMRELAEDERSIYRLSRSNMLLVGSEARVDALITAVTGLPARTLPAWTTIEPGHETAAPETLVVRDVHLLSNAEQARLYDAIGGWMGRVRVIATAPAPVFPLVSRQLFREELYYRLNMLCLEPRRAPEAVVSLP